MQALGNVDAADMVNHHRRFDRGDELVEIDDIIAADVHFNVPAVWRDLLDDPEHLLTRLRRPQMPGEKMQAHAAHAGVVEPLDFGISDRGIEQRGAAITALAGGEHIDKHPVIGAVTGRLHEDTALETEKLTKA